MYDAAVVVFAADTRAEGVKRAVEAQRAVAQFISASRAARGLGETIAFGDPLLVRAGGALRRAFVNDGAVFENSIEEELKASRRCGVSGVAPEQFGSMPRAARAALKLHTAVCCQGP
jgi:hypothetical protein